MSSNSRALWVVLQTLLSVIFKESCSLLTLQPKSVLVFISAGCWPNESYSRNMEFGCWCKYLCFRFVFCRESTVISWTPVYVVIWNPFLKRYLWNRMWVIEIYCLMRDLWYDICNQLLLHRSVEQTAAIVIGSDTAVLRDRKNTRGASLALEAARFGRWCI